MGDGREPDLGEAVVVRDGEGGAGGECDGAFAPREHNEPLDERGPKEPAREREPGEGGQDPLDYAGQGLGASRAGEPEEEKGKGGPAPGAFDEPDIEDVGFAGKVVGFVEGVGEVGEERVGGVEVGVVLDGVDGAEEEDERERYEGCLSGMDADGHDGRGTRPGLGLATTTSAFHVIWAIDPRSLICNDRHSGKGIDECIKSVILKYLLLHIVNTDAAVAFVNETAQQNQPRSAANVKSTRHGQHKTDDAGVQQVRRRRARGLLSRCVVHNV